MSHGLPWVLATVSVLTISSLACGAEVPPMPELKAFYLTVPLVEEGQAKAAVIAPGTEDGQELARLCVGGIKTATGAELPMESAAPENLGELWHHAQAFIVGSYLKKNGQWDQPLDMERINRFIEASKKL